MTKKIFLILILLASAFSTKAEMITATPNIFGGYNYSNGLTSMPNIFGGYNYSNGITTSPNIFGGYNIFD